MKKTLRMDSRRRQRMSFAALALLVAALSAGACRSSRRAPPARAAAATQGAEHDVADQADDGDAPVNSVDAVEPRAETLATPAHPTDPSAASPDDTWPAPPGGWSPEVMNCSPERRAACERQLEQQRMKCEDREDCKVYGWCTRKGDQCVAGSDADCRRAGAARMGPDGECVFNVQKATVCASMQSCSKECRKPGGAGCTRLFKMAEKSFRDRGDPKGPAKAVPSFRLACLKKLPVACKALAYAYGTGQGVRRSFKQSAKYYAMACALTKSDDDCTEAASAKCIADTWSPARRSYALDPYCRPAKAYRPADPSKGIRWDGCFAAMRAVGCTGVNVATKSQSAYCCY